MQIKPARFSAPFCVRPTVTLSIQLHALNPNTINIRKISWQTLRTLKQNSGLSNIEALDTKYRVIKNDCPGFNNLSYTIHLRYEYIVAPMDQEILKVFFYDVRCAVVMHFSAWNEVY